MRYLIIDDHPIVRAGLVHIMKQELQDDELQIDEASNSVEATAMLAAMPYGLVMLDISLAGRNGLDILAQVRRERPQLPVLVVSMYPEDQYALRTFKLGAAGYLSKHAAAMDLVTAIKSILLTGRYISQNVSLLLANEVGHSPRSTGNSHELLSNREIEVACLIARGMTVKEVAECLNLSDRTISTYRSRLLAKMRIRNNVELTSYCIHQGLIA